MVEGKREPKAYHARPPSPIYTLFLPFAFVLPVLHCSISRQLWYKHKDSTSFVLPHRHLRSTDLTITIDTLYSLASVRSTTLLVVVDNSTQPIEGQQ
jgi:hypothetical protein